MPESFQDGIRKFISGQQFLRLVYGTPGLAIYITKQMISRSRDHPNAFVPEMSFHFDTITYDIYDWVLKKTGSNNDVKSAFALLSLLPIASINPEMLHSGKQYMGYANTENMLTIRQLLTNPEQNTAWIRRIRMQLFRPDREQMVRNIQALFTDEDTIRLLLTTEATTILKRDTFMYAMHTLRTTKDHDPQGPTYHEYSRLVFFVH